MARLLRNISKFILLQMLWFLPFISLLYWVGDLRPMSDLINIYEKEPNAVIFVEPPFHLAFKYAGIQEYDPNILIVGSSRSKFFRSDWFSADAKMYNATMFGAFIDSYSRLLRATDTLPDILILEISPVWFNDRYTQDNVFVRDIYPNWIERLRIASRQMLDSTSTMFRTHTFDSLIPTYGFHGRAIGNGFRFDGSYLQPVNDPVANVRNNITLVEEGRWEYVRGGEIQPEKLATLNDLLEYCRSNHIEVIGWIPPYAPTIYDLMHADPDFAYKFEFQQDIQAIFEAFDYPLYDFVNPHDLELTDGEFLNGWHPHEPATYKILQALAQYEPDLLMPFIKLDSMEE